MTVPSRGTIASQNYIYNFVGNPQQGYEINFKFLNLDENVSVFLRMVDGTRVDLQEDVHYTITSATGLNNIWGILTFIEDSGLPTEGVDYLCIYRNIPNDQSKVFDSQTVFSNTVEFALDKLTMLFQDNIESSKFLRAPVDAEIDPSALELPSMNNWTAEKVIGFDNNKKIKLYDYSNPVSNRSLRQPNDESIEETFVISLDTRKNKILGFGKNGQVVMQDTPAAQIQSDWDQTTTSALDFIKNKPKIPPEPIQSDWNQTTTSALDFIKNKPAILSSKIYTASITTTWSGSTGNYSQSIGITGITENDIPIADVVVNGSGTSALNQLDAWSKVGRITTGNNSITLYCYEDRAPTTSFNIQMSIIS
jgi:hypothetical protein